MKKAYQIEIGKTLIYRSLYSIKEAKRVERPIDNIERPKFKIGRIDLDNGEYVLSTTTVYETVEEGEKYLIKDIEKEILDKETQLETLKANVCFLKKICSKLKNKTI